MTTNSAEKSVNILCLEDNPCDHELLEGALTDAGMLCQFVHVKTKPDFESALRAQPFDLIISDFSMPGYDGMSALAAAREVLKETPFIFFSGTIGEERAIESLKNGATDYVLKDRRERLIMAVQRALREAREQTERKHLEAQLRQAQKMEAVGRLAAGVAHDFNNLLAVIQGNAELALLNRGGPGDPVLEHLGQITAASERAAHLTRQLLAFGRKQALHPQVLNLNDVIHHLAKMLRRIIGEDVLLECHCGHAPMFVQADPGMMDQIILNLVVNARDAMPQGGRLKIATKKIVVDAAQLSPESDAQPGEFICLEVGDTGSGIAPADMPRIFEPFFTTKEIGKGSGLGLATVHGIVQQHHGWIELASRVGEGTTFKILLPATPSSAATGRAPEQAQTMRNGGTERILLVEDDAAVRLMTRRLLKEFGYQVIEAASGTEALEVWQNQGSNIDLLLTDIVMPGGINGSELARRLRSQQPALRAVFMSGYSEPATITDAENPEPGLNYFLQKPCHTNVLLDTIRSCLDQPAPIGR